MALRGADFGDENMNQSTSDRISQNPSYMRCFINLKINLKMNTIKQKLRSIELCLSAHPDNEEYSEFADRISDIEIIQKEIDDLIEWKQSAMKILNEIDFQAIGKELDIYLGSSVSEKLLCKIQHHAEKNRIEGILFGLKICKEMWAQGTISHENIYENETMYKEELKNLSERFG